MSDIILFGAGTIGGVIARQLIAKGTPPVQFADNDSSKWDTEFEGVFVNGPQACKKAFPNATWVATVLRTPARAEILDEIAKMNVPTLNLCEFLPSQTTLPPDPAIDTIYSLLGDNQSVSWFADQLEFRKNPSSYVQLPPRDISNVYFEAFFTRLAEEVYWDVGAADGDTVVEFMRKWNDRYKHITAFEPDDHNYNQFQGRHFGPRVRVLGCAVSDFEGESWFISTGDQTAHLSISKKNASRVQVVKLDSIVHPESPTFIKFDVEGAELKALWGARETIRKYSPVLAVCAYHTGDHLWEVPLLIHAINPTYKLFFRRYLEATWEVIWYAVPPERVR